MQLKPLVLMQLKNRLNVSFKVKSKKTLFKVVFGILKFILAIVVSFLIFSLVSGLKIFSLLNLIPTSVMMLITLAILGLSTIFTTVDITKELYFAYDNRILLTFPVSPTKVFSSKLIVSYLYELKKSSTLLLPIYLGYGLFSGFPIYFYLWVLLGIALISFIPVLVGSVLSILLMQIFSIFRRYNIVKIITFTVIIALASLILVLAVINLPDDINLIGNWSVYSAKINSFLDKATNNLAVFIKLTTFVIGYYNGLNYVYFEPQTFITLGYLVLFIVLMIAFTLLINRPIFYKMASKPFEYKKNEEIRNKSNHFHKPFASIVIKDARLNFRSSEKMFNSLYLLIGLPFAILLLNKIFNAIDTSLLGNSLCITFTILMTLLISLSSNAVVASIYSREGKSGYLIKTMPDSHVKFLFSKLVFTLIIGTTSHFILGFVLYYTTNIGVLNTILLTFSLYFIYISHLFYSAEIDIMNPKYNLYLVDSDYVDNPNENKSTVFAFVSALIISVISILLLIENPLVAYYKFFIMASLVLAFRLYQYFAKSKYFYKEKSE